jgi:hypothetical protein
MMVGCMRDLDQTPLCESQKSVSGYESDLLTQNLQRTREE